MQWNHILLEWINCLKLDDKKVKTILELRSGEFFSNLRNLIIKPPSCQEDILSFIFNLLAKHYPLYKFQNETEIHLCDLPEKDLVAIVSLLMHYTCIFDRRDVLTSPLCYSLKPSTQMIIKHFLQKMDAKLDEKRLNKIIDECINEIADSSTENFTSEGSATNSPLLEVLKTPVLKKCRILEKDRVIGKLRADLEAERFEKADLEEELKREKERRNILEKQLSQKGREISKLRGEMAALVNKTPPHSHNQEFSELHRRLRLENENLEQYIEKLESEQEKLIKEKEESMKKMSEFESQCGLLKDKFLELEKENKFLNEELERKSGEFFSLQEHCNEIGAMLDEFREKPNNSSLYEYSYGSPMAPNRSANQSRVSYENLACSVVEVQLREAQKLNEELRGELDDAGLRLKEADGKYRILLEENRDLKLKLDNVRQENKSYLKKLEEASHKMVLTEMLLHASKQDVESLAKERDNFSENLSANLLKYKKLEDEYQEFKTSTKCVIESLKSEIEKSKKSFDSLTTDHHNMLAMLDEANVDCEDYKGRLAVKEAALEKESSKCDQVKLEYAGLNEAYKEQLKLYANAKEKQKEMSESNTLLKQEKEQLNTNLKQANTDLEHNKAELETITALLSTVKSEFDDLKLEKTRIENLLQQKIMELAEIDELKENITENLRRLQDKLEELQLDFKQKLESARVEKEGVLLEKQQIHEKNRLLEEEKAKLEEDLDCKKSILSENSVQFQNLQSEIEQLLKLQNETAKHLDKIVLELDNNKDEVKKLHVTCKNLKEEKNRLNLEKSSIEEKALADYSQFEKKMWDLSEELSKNCELIEKLTVSENLLKENLDLEKSTNEKYSLENENLNKLVKQLRNEIEKHKNDVEMLNFQLNTVYIEQEVLSNDKVTLNTNITELGSKLSSSNDTIKKLESVIKSEAEKIEKLQSELDETKNQLKNLKVENTATETQFRDEKKYLEKQLNCKTDECELLSASKNELELKVKTLQKQFDSISVELSTVLNNFEKVCQTSEHNVAENNRLFNKLQANDKLIGEMENEKRISNDKYLDLEEKYEKLSRSYDSSLAKLKNAEVQVSDRKKELMINKALLSATNAELYEVRSDKMHSENLLEQKGFELNEIIESKESVVKNLRNKLDELNAELVRQRENFEKQLQNEQMAKDAIVLQMNEENMLLQEKKVELVEKNEANSIQIQELESKISSLNEIITKLEMLCKMKTEKCGKMQLELNEADKLTEELNDEVEKMIAQHNETESKSNNERNLLEKQFEIKLKEMVESKESIAENLRHSEGKLIHLNEEIRNQREDLENRIQNINTEMDGIIMENRKLNKEHLLHEEEMAKLEEELVSEINVLNETIRKLERSHNIQVEKLELQINESQKQAEDLRGEIQKMIVNNNENEAKFKDEREILEKQFVLELKDMIKSKETIEESLRQSKEMLDNLNEELVKQHQVFEIQLQNLNLEKDRIFLNNQQLNEDHLLLQEGKAKLKEELDNKISSLNDTITKLELYINESQKQIEDLKKEIKKTIKQNNENETKFKEERNVLENQLQMKLRETVESKESIAENLRQTEEDNEEIRRQHNNLEIQLQNLNLEKDCIELKNQQLNEENVLLQEEKTKLNDEVETKIGSLNETIGQLETFIKTEAEKSAKLQLELNKSENQREGLKEEIKKIIEQNNEAEAKFKGERDVLEKQFEVELKKIEESKEIIAVSLKQSERKLVDLNEELVNQRESIEIQLQNLNMEKNDIVLNNQQLNTDHLMALEKNANLQEEIKLLNETITNLNISRKAQLEEIKLVIKELHKQACDKKKEFHDLNEETKSKLKEIENQLTNKTSECKSLNNAKNNMELKIKTLEREVNEVNVNFKQVTEQLENSTFEKNMLENVIKQTFEKYVANGKENNEYKRKLEEKNNLIEKLENEKKNLVEEVANLEVHLEDCKKELEVTKTMLSTTSIECDKIKLEKQETENVLEQMEIKLIEMGNMKDGAQQALVKLEEKLPELLKQCNNNEKQLQNLNTEKDAIILKNDHLNEENVILQEEKAELNKHFECKTSSLNEIITTLETEVEKSKLELTQAQKQITILKEEIAKGSEINNTNEIKFENERKVLDKLLTDKTIEFNLLSDVNNEMKLKIKTLQNQFDAVNTELTSTINNLSQVTEELVALNCDRNGLEITLKQTTEMYEVLLREKCELNSKLVDNTKLVKELENAKKTLGEENVILEEKYQTLSRTYEDSMDQLTNFELQLEDSKKELEKERDIAQASLDKHNEEVASLNKDQDTLVIRVKELENEKISLLEEQTRLLEQVKKLEDEKWAHQKQVPIKEEPLVQKIKTEKVEKENILTLSSKPNAKSEEILKKENLTLKRKLLLMENDRNKFEKKVKELRLQQGQKPVEQTSDLQYKQLLNDYIRIKEDHAEIKRNYDEMMLKCDDFKKQKPVVVIESDKKLSQDLDNLREAYSNVVGLNLKYELENKTLRKIIEDRNLEIMDFQHVKEAYEKLLEENNKLITEVDTVKYKRSRDKDECVRLLRKEREEAQSHEAKMVHQIRSEYEVKLQQMKDKMIKLYRDEVGKEYQKFKDPSEKNMLMKTIANLKSELLEAQQKIQLLEMKRDFTRGQSTADIYSSRESIRSNFRERTSIASTVSRESIASNNKSMFPPQTMQMEDEEDMFNDKYLTDLKEGRCPSAAGRESTSSRCSQLAWRNSMVPQHLKSSYPAETQFISPSHFKDDDLKAGTVQLDDSLCQLLPGEKTRSKKDFGTTSYKKPGPPTPSKNGGRTSLQGNEVKEHCESKTPKRSTPSRLKALFSSRNTTSNSGESQSSTPSRQGRRLNIFRKPK